MARKTLHDIVLRPKRKSVGAIPQAFHRHGPVTSSPTAIVVTPYSMPIKTETQKMVAYGVIAAGDSMVPDSTEADVSLVHALRKAVSHRLMTEVGAHEQPIAMEQWIDNDSVYWSALEFMVHFGTANHKSKLAVARKNIRARGFRRQANILESFIAGAVDMAMDHDRAGIEWFYKEFHALYGSQDKPNPKEEPGPKKEPLPELPEFPIELKASPAQGAPWGQLRPILRAPMEPWKHPRIRSRKSWKYSEFGVFKYPWRALPSSDYRCFSLQRSQYAGTLLIDMSSSMSINQSQVDLILNLAPYATIACYGSGKDILSSGSVVVIAEDMKKGSSAFARRHIGSGNVVDGPALRWLASQAPPRIWISDGGVTGVDDQSSAALYAEVGRIVQAGHITQVGNLESLINQLT